MDLRAALREERHDRSLPGVSRTEVAGYAAKEKVTITVDRAKLSEARAVLGVSSASAAIDVALP